MKQLLFIICYFSFFLSLASCQREETLPEATSAAQEVYLQYADREDLTVALVGDYKGYNAVMLRADDAEGWLRLCKELGANKQVGATALDSVRVSSLTTATVDTSTFRYNGPLDSNGSIAIPGTIGEFLSDLLDSVAKGETGRLLWDTAYTVTKRQTWQNGELVNESHDTVAGTASSPLSDDRLFHLATNHGDRGYLTYSDSKSLTLWIFFFSTKEEFSQIINTITLTH